jgi:hypothetical protein
VIDASDGRKMFGIVSCSVCYPCTVYKKKDGANAVDFGTKNLVDHADRCGKPDPSGAKQSTLAKILRLRAKPTLSKSVPDKIRKSEVQFIGGCQLACNVVDSPHFKQLVNIIDLGAQHGNVTVSDGRKTVSSDITRMAEEVKKAIENIIYDCT